MMRSDVSPHPAWFRNLRRRSTGGARGTERRDCVCRSRRRSSERGRWVRRGGGRRARRQRRRVYCVRPPAQPRFRCFCLMYVFGNSPRRLAGFFRFYRPSRRRQLSRVRQGKLSDRTFVVTPNVRRDSAAESGMTRRSYPISLCDELVRIAGNSQVAPTATSVKVAPHDAQLLLPS